MLGRDIPNPFRASHPPFVVRCVWPVQGLFCYWRQIPLLVMEEENRAVNPQVPEIAVGTIDSAVDETSGAVDRVMEDPGYQEFATVWQGILVTVRYNPCWLGRCAGLQTHHIELRSADRVELPVTSTGYRSHFLHGEEPFAAFDGDVLAYVQAWLDGEAERPEWKRFVEESRQLSLF